MEKPVLDEGAFQHLLAAAYVIQQQMDDLRMAPQTARQTWSARPSSEDALAVIAETQERLRSGTWDIGLAANLVGERLQRITRAEGVAIAVERAGMLEYVCAIGSTSGLAGVSIPVPADLGVAWAGREDRQETSASAVGHSGREQNDIALPLTHDGKLAGIVEVRFPGGAIQDSERRCCQLMAGLMTEAMARTAQAEWERALATERSTLLEELERIIPEMGGPTEAPSHGTKPPALTEAPIQSPASAGHETSFEGAKAQGLREGPASPAKPRHAQGKAKRRVKASEQPAMEHAAEDQNVPSVAAETEALAVQEFQTSSLSSTGTAELEGENQAISVAPVAAPQAEAWNPWISSVRARQWLEALEANGPARRWLGVHRSDLYLAVAIVILAFSIGLLVHNPQPAVAQSKNPQPSLSLFEKILVALDLAEPPANMVYAGNPNTMVWVDVHTALYYCPGAELYGKTDGGKLTTQRDAQIDQFQPAERRSCN